ncbi:MAG TPA: 5'/3'-nucleotidase SurE [Anaerolineae bacterium]
MPDRPLILITNDDGIKSKGLRAAAAVCEDLGELLIVAPVVQQSGAGRSMPPSSEGRIYPEDIEINNHTVVGYGVEATPAQAVQHGLFEIATRPVSLIVSGINYGENIGEGITVSGTVGAAIEGASLGVPAIAVSRQTEREHYYSHSADLDFSAAAHYLRRFAEAILQHGLPPGVDLIKIEVPQDATVDTPHRWTRISRQRYFYPIVPQRRRPDDPGPMGYEIRIDGNTLEPDSDVQAVAVDKVVSITPVTLDLTARVDFQQLSAWLEQK